MKLSVSSQIWRINIIRNHNSVSLPPYGEKNLMIFNRFLWVIFFSCHFFIKMILYRITRKRHSFGKTLIKTIWNIINHSRRVKSLLGNCSFRCEWVDRLNLLFSVFPFAGEKKCDEKLLWTTFLIVFLRTWKTYVHINVFQYSRMWWYGLKNCF